MREHVFENNIIDDVSIDNIINNLEQREAILNYLETDEDEGLQIYMNRRKNINAKRIQNLYRDSPRKAMRYYIDKKATPACNIPIENITREFGA